MANNPPYGQRFGRPDLERNGLFAEMSYMHGKPSQAIKPDRIVGANFLNSSSKTKCGTQDGYFENEFRRLFVGEAIPRGEKKIKKSDTVIPFMVNSTAKKHSTPGDSYGCFDTHISAFSPSLKPKPPYKHEPPNIVWRCGKICGPGYADTGIDKYPTHMTDPYGIKLIPKQYGVANTNPFLTAVGPGDYFDQNPFAEHPQPTVGLYLDSSGKPKSAPGIWMPTGPAKDPGGNHAGCFNPFPEYMACKYVSELDANKPRSKEDGIFMPIPSAPKSQYTSSILHYNVDIGVNSTTYKSYVPSYVKYLLSGPLY